MEIKIMEARPTNVREKMQNDGWNITVEGSQIIAYHDRIKTEEEARVRLLELEMLTSNDFHIDFLS